MALELPKFKEKSKSAEALVRNGEKYNHYC